MWRYTISQPTVAGPQTYAHPIPLALLQAFMAVLSLQATAQAQQCVSRDGLSFTMNCDAAKGVQWVEYAGGDCTGPPVSERTMLEVVCVPLGSGSAALSCADTYPAPQWAQLGYDNRHTGQSPYTGPAFGRVRWLFRFAGYLSAPAVGGDGTLYFGSYYNEFFALNGSTGVVLWTAMVDGGVPYSPAISADGGSIFFSSNDASYVYALSAVGGYLQWSYKTKDTYLASPTVGNDGRVYISAEEDLYALSPTGSLLWSFSSDVANVCYFRSSPAVAANGQLYVGCIGASGGTNTLYSLSSAGTQQWTFVANDGFASAPTLGLDGTVYVSCVDSSLYALAPGGTLIWSFNATDDRTDNSFASGPALGTNGLVYVGSLSGEIYGINANGTLPPVWKSDACEYPLYSAPIVGADGTVYVCTTALNGSTGEAIWNYAPVQTTYGSAVIGRDGTLFVSYFSKGMYAYNDAAPPPPDNKPGGEGVVVPIVSSLAVALVGTAVGIWYCRRRRKCLWKSSEYVPPPSDVLPSAYGYRGPRGTGLPAPSRPHGSALPSSVSTPLLAKRGEEDSQRVAAEAAQRAKAQEASRLQAEENRRQVEARRLEEEANRERMRQEEQTKALKAEQARMAAEEAAATQRRVAATLPEDDVIVSDGPPLGRGAFGLVRRATLRGEAVCVKVRTSKSVRLCFHFIVLCV